MRECDICPQPATVISPATRGRELAFYCDFDAERICGWPEKSFRIDELTEDQLAKLIAKPDYGGRFGSPRIERSR